MNNRVWYRCGMSLAIVLIVLSSNGCWRMHDTLESAVDLNRFNDAARASGAQPALQLPVRVAVAHLQHGPLVPGEARFAHALDIEVRPIGGDHDEGLLARVRPLPHVTDVVTIHPDKDAHGRTLVEPTALLPMAQRLQADLLLVYSNEVTLGDSEFAAGPIGFVLTVGTLGVFPGVLYDGDAVTHVRLVDAQTGYVYLSDSAGRHAWTLDGLSFANRPFERVCRRAERRAEQAVFAELGYHWRNICKYRAPYHRAPATAPAGERTPHGPRYPTR